MSDQAEEFEGHSEKAIEAPLTLEDVNNMDPAYVEQNLDQIIERLKSNPDEDQIARLKKMKSGDRSDVLTTVLERAKEIDRQAAQRAQENAEAAQRAGEEARRNAQMQAASEAEYNEQVTEYHAYQKKMNSWAMKRAAARYRSRNREQLAAEARDRRDELGLEIQKDNLSPDETLKKFAEYKRLDREYDRLKSPFLTNFIRQPFEKAAGVLLPVTAFTVVGGLAFMGMNLAHGVAIAGGPALIAAAIAATIIYKLVRPSAKKAGAKLGVLEARAESATGEAANNLKGIFELRGEREGQTNARWLSLFATLPLAVLMQQGLNAVSSHSPILQTLAETKITGLAGLAGQGAFEGARATLEHGIPLIGDVINGATSAVGSIAAAFNTASAALSLHPMILPLVVAAALYGAYRLYKGMEKRADRKYAELLENPVAEPIKPAQMSSTEDETPPQRRGFGLGRRPQAF